MDDGDALESAETYHANPRLVDEDDRLEVEGKEMWFNPV